MELELGFSLSAATQTQCLEILRDRRSDREGAPAEKLMSECGRGEWLMAAAHLAGIPLIPGIMDKRDRTLADGLDINVLRRHLCMPIKKCDGRLTIAVAEPLSQAGADYCLSAFSDCSQVQRVAVPLTEIEKGLGQSAAEAVRTTELAHKVEGAVAVTAAATIEIGSGQSGSQIIEYIEGMLERAIDARASDIHLWTEAASNGSLLRQAFRINGRITEREVVPPQTQAPLDAVLLSMVKGDRQAAGRGDILDESITVKTRTGRNIPCRYSRMPNPHGFHITIRILDKIDLDLTLGQGTLTFPDAEFLAIERFLEMNDGLGMISGATGSGKSTTLAGMLKRLAVPGEITMTVENPIETEIPNVIHQLLKDESQFVAYRRGIMRSDPDNIMIGEIRDAEVCMQAMDLAITGHLVITSIHSATAADILARCKSWGVPVYDLLRVVRLLMAQRLVDVVCKSCATRARPTDRERLLYHLPDDIREIDLIKASPEGCENCRQTGYSHRQVLAEVLSINEDLIREIRSPETLATDVERICREQYPELRSLRDQGLDLLRGQVTDIAAVRRAMNLSY